jgi:hypothetical protein
MNRKIKIENLAVINNIISNTQPENLREILREHSSKKNAYMYSLEDLKPGSDKYISNEKKLEEIALLPEHNIQYTDDIVILGKYNKEILSLTLGTYTTTKMSKPSRYYDEDDCYDYDEPREYEVTYTFLVKNQYHLHSVYLKFSDLFSEYNNIFREWLEITADNQYYALHNSYKEDYRKYISLFEKDIRKAFAYGYDVSIDNDRDMRGFNRELYLKIEGAEGTKKHYLSMLDEILSIKYYWYEDKKMRFGSNYNFKDVLEEYEYAKDNICE